MLNNYICALDIGSSKIAACVAEVKKKGIGSIFFDNMPSKGVKEGIIVDSIDLVGCIGKLLKNLKTKSGINIKLLCTNISGKEIVTKHSRAIMPLAERGNKVIAASDMERVKDQARVLGSSLDEEIIHTLPLSYSIDSKSNVANPLGLYSHRLEVDLYLVCATLSSVQSLVRVINQSGYGIKDIFFSGISTSKVVFDKETQKGFNLFCDIGSDTTELLFFRDGIIRDIEILPFGGDNLTAGLAEALKIPLELAEDIKRSYGIIGDSLGLSEDKEILVKKTTLYKPIKQKLVSEIITQSAKSICSDIRSAVEGRFRTYEINNFIIAGRTIMLEGFIETLENTLNIPVKVARMANTDIPYAVREDIALSGQKYLMYLTCLGMVCEALQEKQAGIFPLQTPSKNLILKAINRFKEVYQEYF